MLETMKPIYVKIYTRTILHSYWPRAGVLNASIAIYRSIAKVVLVDRVTLKIFYVSLSIPSFD